MWYCLVFALLCTESTAIEDVCESAYLAVEVTAAPTQMTDKTSRDVEHSRALCEETGCGRPHVTPTLVSRTGGVALSAETKASDTSRRPDCGSGSGRLLVD